MDYINIDTYISKVKDEQIIKDYLETGIFRLDTNHRKVMSTKLHQDMSYIISPPTDIDNITDDIKIHNLMNDLNKIEAEIKLVWIESPNNPLLKLVDIQAIASYIPKTNSDSNILSDKGFPLKTLLAVDNTFCTPYL